MTGEQNKHFKYSEHWVSGIFQPVPRGVITHANGYDLRDLPGWPEDHETLAEQARKLPRGPEEMIDARVSLDLAVNRDLWPSLGL